MAKKPLHIAILSTFFDPFMSGAEMCVDEIANRLGRKDAFAITIITARLKRSLPAFENRGRYVIVRVGWGWRGDKWLYPLLAARKAKQMTPDIVHAIMESYAGIALWMLGFLSHGSRRILTLQSGDLDEKVSIGKIPVWLWKRIHRSPDIVTAISTFLVDRAHAHQAHRVEHIPNGVSLGKLDFIRTQIKPEDKDVNSIACVARLSPEKGVMELIEACALLRERKPELHLHVIGDGPQRKEIEKLIEEKGLAECVTLHGRLPYEQAMDRLARTHVAVLPSRAEGLGIAGLEALALGIPVVASRVGGIPDFIVDEKTGLLVPPNKPAELARAIERMFDESVLYKKCLRNAEAMVKNYEWKTIAGQYADMYREILTSRICIATGIYPPDPGGPATYVQSLEEFMEGKGVHACTITYADTSETRHGQFRTSVRVNRKQSVVMRYVNYLWKMLVHARRYDVIYAQDSMSAGLPARIAASILGKPLVVKVVGDPAWERAQQNGVTTDNVEEFQKKRYDLRTEIVRAISRSVVRAADRVITPSEYLKGVVQTWGIPADRIHVVLNAVSFPRESEPVEGWPHGRVILYVGRLVSWKGLEHIVSVLPVLARELTDVHFVLLGDGPERERIVARAHEAGIQERVHFMGNKSRAQVQWAMEHASVFVLFSTYEGLAHVLIEAQHAGVPIVASTAGGNGEVVTHKQSGLLIEPDDNIALLKSIRLLLTDEAVAQKLIAGGKESVVRFTKERMLDETYEIFKGYARSAYQL